MILIIVLFIILKEVLITVLKYYKCSAGLGV
jgi:hypothetical protein